MPAWFAAAMNSPDIAASAMLIPPDADPVMPASVVTVTASLIRGLGIAERASLITRNPGSDAITAPKTYSEAVFIEATSDPQTAALLPSANFSATVRNAKTKTVRMPISSAPRTAQMATIAGHRGLDRMIHAGKLHLVGDAVELRNHHGEDL